MVSCIMGTCGDFKVACEALTCFLQQDYLNKELIIVNHGEAPLYFTHSQVTILNLKPEEVPTLRHVRMVGIQKSNGKYFHFWDNDDLYLPWHLTDCMNGIKNTDKTAWKPEDVWMSCANKEYDRSQNTCEGSWILDRTKISLDEYYTKHPQYADSPFYWDILMSGDLEETVFGALTSYVYRWAGESSCHSSHDYIAHNSKPSTNNYINDYSIIAENYRKNITPNQVPKNGWMRIMNLKKYWKDIINNCLHPPSTNDAPELYDKKMKKKLEEKFAPYIRERIHVQCECGEKWILNNTFEEITPFEVNCLCCKT